MFQRGADRLHLLIIVATFLGGLAALAILPPEARLPTHFNAQGDADGWSAASMVLLFIPSFLTLLRIVEHLCTRVRPNSIRFSDAVDRTAVASAFAFASLQVYLICLALGYVAPTWRVMALFAGWLILASGNFLGKIQLNDAYGFRLSWTTINPEVWDQTHRFAGKAFVLAGLAVMLLATMEIPFKLRGFVIGGPVIAATLVTAAKSYWLARTHLRGDRRHANLRLAVKIPFFLLFAYGVVNFYDGPYKPCGVEMYCGKGGTHHTAADAEAYGFWLRSMLGSFALAAVGSLILSNGRKG